VTRPPLALPVCRHTPGDAGGGPLPAAAGRRHVIHAPPGGLQRPRPGAPAGSVAPGLQPGGPPVVADVHGGHGRSGPVPPRGAPWWGPGGDGVPSRVGRGTAKRPPEPAPPAQVVASPGAVGGRQGVSSRGGSPIRSTRARQRGRASPRAGVRGRCAVMAIARCGWPPADSDHTARHGGSSRWLRRALCERARMT
jgi:hypothetical protein